MEILKILSFAIVASVVCFYLKSINSDIYIPAIMVSSVSLFVYVLTYLNEVYFLFDGLFNTFNVDKNIFSLLLKVVIISYLIEFSSSLIEDLGIKGLSEKLIFVGKIILFCMSIPIFSMLLDLIGGFLELI